MVRFLASRLLAACALLVLSLLSAQAHAAEPVAKGVTVLVLGDPQLAAATWSLARDVYASTALLPSGITEPRARSLVGQPATTPETKELAELRDGVHDEGAVSRRVLAAIASSTRAAAVAVVRAADAPGHVQIRLYLVDRGAFDVTLFDGDPSDPSWRSDVVNALERRFDPQVATQPGARAKLATAKPSETASSSHPFYKSPWFWGAVGAAVLLGGTALVVTKVTESNDVRVRVEPPAASSAALRF